MSFTKTVTILCDQNGCRAWEQARAPYNRTTAIDTRKELTLRGWSHKNGKDFCPYHTDENETG